MYSSQLISHYNYFFYFIDYFIRLLHKLLEPGPCSHVCECECWSDRGPVFPGGWYTPLGASSDPRP